MSRRSLISGSVIIILWLVTIGFLVRNQVRDSAPDITVDKNPFFRSVEIAEKWQRIEEYMLLVHVEPSTN